MQRDVAVRLDAMLITAGGIMDHIAHYLKNNASEEEYKEYVSSIGNAMGQLFVISNSLHNKFPDILPNELKPENK